MPTDGLRAIFDEDAELYDRTRPRYPAGLIADLAELAEIGPGSQVAEIGPGTGQATLALAALGASVTAIELGASLAGVLSRNVAGAPVDVVVSAFEDWPLPDEPVDSLVAFTAWHWLDPAVRTVKAAAALRSGGTLATVTTVHVAGGTQDFFSEVQACYEQWDPATPPGLRLRAVDAVEPVVDEVDVSDLFEAPVRRRYLQDVAYSAHGYLELLATYSGHRALSSERRQGLFTCIGQLIAEKHDGVITKRYLYELRLARRRQVFDRMSGSS